MTSRKNTLMVLGRKGASQQITKKLACYKCTCTEIVTWWSELALIYRWNELMDGCLSHVPEWIILCCYMSAIYKNLTIDDFDSIVHFSSEIDWDTPDPSSSSFGNAANNPGGWHRGTFHSTSVVGTSLWLDFEGAICGYLCLSAIYEMAKAIRFGCLVLLDLLTAHI